MKNQLLTSDVNKFKIRVTYSPGKTIYFEKKRYFLRFKTCVDSYFGMR